MKSVGLQARSTDEIAELLARGYLRLQESREREASNPACCPKVTADRIRSNCLDVAAQQSDELDAQPGIRRRPCKPAWPTKSTLFAG